MAVTVQWRGGCGDGTCEAAQGVVAVLVGGSVPGGLHQHQVPQMGRPQGERQQPALPRPIQAPRQVQVHRVQSRQGGQLLRNVRLCNRN